TSRSKWHLGQAARAAYANVDLASDLAQSRESRAELNPASAPSKIAQCGTRLDRHAFRVSGGQFLRRRASAPSNGRRPRANNAHYRVRSRIPQIRKPERTDLPRPRRCPVQSPERNSAATFKLAHYQPRHLMYDGAYSR